VFTVWQLSQAPKMWQDAATLEVTPGMSVRDIAAAAKANNLVRSEGLLFFVLSYFHDPTRIFAGQYLFITPATVLAVAEKLAASTIESDTIALTFPEGIRVRDMATIAARTLDSFSTIDYLALTSGKEGRLFPETYFVPRDYSAEALVELQETTFADTIEVLRVNYPSIDIDQAVIIASILEREANDAISMGLVAGIFNNRLAIGMPLQADATIEYTIETPLGELPPGELARKLREFDSPYNSYLNRGLPPTAIGNPGLQALQAAFAPTPSDYFYYITGNDGNFYYAETFDEHNQNINRHLR